MIRISTMQWQLKHLMFVLVGIALLFASLRINGAYYTLFFVIPGIGFLVERCWTRSVGSLGAICGGVAIFTIYNIHAFEREDFPALLFIHAVTGAIIGYFVSCILKLSW